jgi:hypothetical protein
MFCSLIYSAVGFKPVIRVFEPIPVAVRSAAERLLRSWVRISLGHECLSLVSVCGLSGRGLCDFPIPRPEESYRLWYVSECEHVKNKNLDTYCE